MPVKVRCPECRKVLNAPDKARGKAIRCPECRTPVKVPASDAGSSRSAASRSAGSRRRRPKPEDDESNPFASLDLRQVEDRSVRLCPRCGSEVDEEEVDCPGCGINVETGQLGERLKRKAAEKKGIDPVGYYENGLRNALKFLGRNKKLAFRSAWIFVLYSLLAGGGLFMVSWCSNAPPKFFWGMVTAILVLVVPGWTWFLWTEIINLSLEKKKKPGKLNFDLFLCTALGIKAYFWNLFFSLPITLFTGIAGGLIGMMAGPLVGAGIAASGALLIIPAIPIAMSHMAMPIQGKGWLAWKVVPKVIRYIGPCLHWTFFFVLSMLPAAAIVAGVVYYSASDLVKLEKDLSHNNYISRAKAYEVGKNAEKPAWVETWENREPVSPDYMVLAVPAGGLALANLMFAFGAVFSMRLNGQLTYYLRKDLDLEMQGKELKYVSLRRAKEEPLKAQPADMISRWKGMFIDNLLAGASVAGIGWLVEFALTMNDGSQESIEMVRTVTGIAVPIAQWLYFARGESSEDMATTGKKAAQVFVVDKEGNRLSFAKASQRYNVKFWISGWLTCGLGYLMAFFDKDGRALHDRICGTMVKRG